MPALTDQLFYYNPADYSGTTIESATGAGTATIVGNNTKLDGSNFSYISFSDVTGAARFDLPAIGEYTHFAVMRINFPFTSGDYMHLLTNNADQLNYLIKRLVNISVNDIDPGELYHYRDQSQASAGLDLFPPTEKWFMFTARASAGTLTCSIVSDEGSAGIALTQGTSVLTLNPLLAGTYSIGRPSTLTTNTEGGPFDLGPFGFFDRVISEEEERNLFREIFFPQEEILQTTSVSGVVQVNGQAARRKVRAFTYNDALHDIDGVTVLESKSLGSSFSDSITGEYTINLLRGFNDNIFVAAFDDYGRTFLPNTAVSVGDRVHPTTPSGYVFETTAAGTLPSTEPTWILDTTTSQLYGSAELIARQFYQPIIQGPFSPNVVTTISDINFDNVSLLLHMDGDSGSTIFIDSSSFSNNVTASGGAIISTTESLFGQSGRFTGDTSRLTVPSSPELVLDGDFTIEAAVWIEVAPAAGDTYTIIDKCGVFGSAYPTYNIHINDQRRIVAQLGKTGATIDRTLLSSGSEVVPLSTFNHIALVRNGSLLTLYLNGITYDSAAIVSEPLDNGEPLTIGAVPSTNSETLDGYLDEVRITKDVARYTENFTPPELPFADQAPPFSPSDLFSNNQDGAWYDPSDLTTLFQDSAGTVPVQLSGDIVRRVLDKSGNDYHLTSIGTGTEVLYQTDGTKSWLQTETGGKVLAYDFALGKTWPHTYVISYYSTSNYVGYISLSEPSSQDNNSIFVVGDRGEAEDLRPAIATYSEGNNFVAAGLGLLSPYTETILFRFRSDIQSVTVGEQTASISEPEPQDLSALTIGGLRRRGTLDITSGTRLVGFIARFDQMSPEEEANAQEWMNSKISES